MKPTSPSEDSNTAAAPKKSPIVAWLIGLPVIIFAVLMLIGKFMNDPQREQRWIDSETVKICWKQVVKPEAERKTQEFHSQADCDRLEQIFKQKYNENP
ncbi:MAG: hypothetical protein LBJ15_00050 [Comamonas sp.]|jgi:hypothetical protein|uniref:hypothetical protein n=1 Tax=Comamonas sp. TaxID=34028 RepID=UPI0028328596|nr:hypothetical protein [Comamonas sp.]MDR0212377.1 hypothetical protein [Comamonas sp.]